jgi:hypothetical protein
LSLTFPLTPGDIAFSLPMFSTPQLACRFPDKAHNQMVAIFDDPVDLLTLLYPQGLRQGRRADEIVLPSLVCSLDDLYFGKASYGEESFT